MSKKRVILSDSSLNRYGYRIMSAGLNFEAFKKNPVMLYMHFRDEGSPIWGDAKAIGHWEDIQMNGDELSAIPVFDDACELSRTIHAKYDAGTYSAASIGIRIIATSANKDLLLPGQTRETVTESELMEASIVDIPANANAVRLYNQDHSNSVFLATGMDTQVVPELKINHSMKFNEKWNALLAFLGIDKANIGSAELSVDQLDKVDGELERLELENKTLADEKTATEGKLSEKDSEIATLKTEVTNKDQEIATLKGEATTKDQDITELKSQVENLKRGPAGGNGKGLTPSGESTGEDTNDLADFAAKNDGNHVAIAEEIRRQGFI